ncbi:hypothetical protein T492DRAFT_34996 [Pavlovales sp. CCMP2436]|nr:hypothetical protein T492DRAFT_34996 [Pavlovales sp. CCMP2436]
MADIVIGRGKRRREGRGEEEERAAPPTDVTGWCVGAGDSGPRRCSRREGCTHAPGAAEYCTLVGGASNEDLPPAALSLQQTTDGSLRVQFTYPQQDLGNWNGVIALFPLLCMEDDSVSVGWPLLSSKKRAYRKVLANKPTGTVTFSARSLERERGCYTFALLLDSLHERLGWRCLAMCEPFYLDGTSQVGALTSEPTAGEAHVPIGSAPLLKLPGNEINPTAPAALDESELVEAWLGDV